MRSWRRWRGQHGEQMAVQFLQRQGYRILHQNYRCRGGEVDIVAWDGPTLGRVCKLGCGLYIFRNLRCGKVTPASEFG